MATYTIKPFTTTHVHSFNKLIDTTSTIKKHYFIKSLEGFENFYYSKVRSVEVEGNKLHIFMLINPTDEASILNRIDAEVVFNLNTNKYTFKAIGKGSRKYKYEIERNVDVILNSCFEEASMHYVGDIAESVDQTTDYYCNNIKNFVADKAEQTKLSNELYYEIGHNSLSIQEIENLFDSMINEIKLTKNEKVKTDNKSYTVGNRNFTTYEQATVYCDSVDFDYSMIVEDNPSTISPEVFYLYNNTFNTYTDAFNYALANSITVTMILSSKHQTMTNARLQELEKAYVFSKYNMPIDDLKEYYDYIQTCPLSLDKEERYYKLKSMIERYENKQKRITERKEKELQLAEQSKKLMDYMLENGLKIDSSKYMTKYILNDKVIHVWTNQSLSVNEYYEMITKMYNDYFKEIAV